MNLSVIGLELLPACGCACSIVFNSAVQWTLAHQALLSVEFSRQEYWEGGCHFLNPSDLPDPGIEPSSLASPALGGEFFTTVPPGKPGATIIKHL